MSDDNNSSDPQKAAAADPTVPLPPGMIAGMEKWLEPSRISAWRDGKLNYQ